MEDRGNGGRGRGDKGELTVNNLMLLREGSDVWRDTHKGWDEGIDAYGCHCNN